jgi:leucyl-tRNA synthetase
LKGKSGKFVSIHSQPWPEYKNEDLAGGKVTLVVQVDGKLRGRLEMEAAETKDKETVEAAAREIPNVMKFIGANPKVVFVSGKLINFINPK